MTSNTQKVADAICDATNIVKDAVHDAKNRLNHVPRVARGNALRRMCVRWAGGGRFVPMVVAYSGARAALLRWPSTATLAAVCKALARPHIFHRRTMEFSAWLARPVGRARQPSIGGASQAAQQRPQVRNLCTYGLSPPPWRAPKQCVCAKAPGLSFSLSRRNVRLGRRQFDYDPTKAPPRAISSACYRACGSRDLHSLPLAGARSTRCHKQSRLHANRGEPTPATR